MKPHTALKNKLKSGGIALALALMLTTICHAQHNVIYWNGDSTNLQTLASSSYDVVIVDFVTPDQNCDLSWGGTTPNGGLPSDIGTSIQTLHLVNPYKIVLVSFGGADNVDPNTGEDYTSEGYQACSYNMSYLVNQLQTIANTNGFDGVDIDFEDTNAFLNSSDPNHADYDGVAFLVQLTVYLYDNMVTANGINIITHAPQSPYWFPVGDPEAEGFNWGYPGGPYQWIEKNTYAYEPYPYGAAMISWYNNQFYDNQVDDQDDATKVNAYKNISGVTGTARLLMGVALDNSIEGSIMSPQDMVQNVIQPLQNFSTSNGSSFGGVMAWDYDDDLNNWGGAWGSTAGQALGIAPGVSSAETAHAGLSAGAGLSVDAGLSAHAHAGPSAHAGQSKRHSRCGAGTKNECPAGPSPRPGR